MTTTDQDLRTERVRRARLLAALDPTESTITEAIRLANNAYEHGDAAWYAYAFGAMRGIVMSTAEALVAGDVPAATDATTRGVALFVALDGAPAYHIETPAFPTDPAPGLDDDQADSPFRDVPAPTDLAQPVRLLCPGCNGTDLIVVQIAGEMVNRCDTCQRHWSVAA